MAASWPTSVATDANLYVAVNELQTNLSSSIDNVQTSITLNSTTSFPTAGVVLIDNEVITYTGISGSNLTGCTRGADGTSAASHSSAAVVSFAYCAIHHNTLKDEIKAIETYLSSNLGTGSQPLSNGHRALASNASGKIVEATTTDTELGYLSGVTSAIQTQLNAKAPTASPTFTGTIGTALTASKALQTDSSGNLQASSVTTTELGYLSGVTSAIQTQLNALSVHVFQIVSATTNTLTTSTNSSAFSDVVSISITPSNSSHKILIIACGNLESTAPGTVTAHATLRRGATNLATGAGTDLGQFFLTATGSGDSAVPCCVCFLDSPATTSSTTYNLSIAGNGGTGSVKMPADGGTAVIIAIEVV